MRPTKLTPELQKKIVDTIKQGNYVETAAALAGIHKSTLYDWMKRGARESDRLAQNPKAKPKQKEEPYMEFSDAITRALAFAEARDVQVIAKASEEDWRASAWRLERRHPKKWGKKEQVSADVNHSGETKEVKEYNVFHKIDEYTDVFKQMAERERSRDRT